MARTKQTKGKGPVGRRRMLPQHNPRKTKASNGGICPCMDENQGLGVGECYECMEVKRLRKYFNSSPTGSQKSSECMSQTRDEGNNEKKLRTEETADMGDIIQVPDSKHVGRHIDTNVNESKRPIEVIEISDSEPEVKKRFSLKRKVRRYSEREAILSGKTIIRYKKGEGNNGEL